MQKRTFSRLLLTLLFVAVCGQRGLPFRGKHYPVPVTNGDAAVSILHHASVRSLLRDAKGIFWFGSDGDGLFRYDGKRFIRYTKNEGLTDNQVRTIQQDNSGNLWLETGNGVCRYDGSTFTPFPERPAIQIDYFGRTFSGTTEGLWFGARDGAFHYDGTSFTFLPLPLDESDKALRRSHPGANRTAYSVYSVLRDKSGNVWFGTEQRGVCRYDGKHFVWRRDKGLNVAVRTIYQDRTGNIWFGTNGGGAFRYNGKTVTNVTREYGLENPDFPKTGKGKPGTLARVWSIAEDTAGNLWFGTIDAGAWRYDGKSLTNVTVKDGLNGNAVLSILRDTSGTLWFGFDGGGVCSYDGKSFINITKDAVER